MIDNTMANLWIAKNSLDNRADRLARAGNGVAAHELRQSASRLGDALLEVESVVQQYAADIAAIERDGEE